MKRNILILIFILVTFILKAQATSDSIKVVVLDISTLKPIKGISACQPPYGYGCGRTDTNGVYYMPVTDTNEIVIDFTSIEYWPLRIKLSPIPDDFLIYVYLVSVKFEYDIIKFNN